MSQLHKILAVLPSLKGRAQKIISETLRTFSKPQHFTETLKTYEPILEGEPTQPDEHTPASTTVAKKLDHVAEMFGPWIDATYQVDKTNTEARADLKVDGLKIEGVPSTFLMQLDKRLSEIRNLYDHIPTLDPKHEWSRDESKGENVFAARPVDTYRTKKTLQSKVLYEATENHPAQVEKWAEDIRCGKYTTRVWSGMITTAQKYEVLNRIDKLQHAVRAALSEANQTEHSTERIAEDLFNYIHGK